MSLPPIAPSKPEMLLNLALAAYLPCPADAAAQAKVRRGLEAIVQELRRIEAIPASDIDQFVADAKAGAGADSLMMPAVLLANMLPDVDFYAALVDAGFSEEDLPTPAHPKFLEAGNALVELNEKYGDSAHGMPEYDAWWKQLMEYAPPQFIETMREGAKRFGLLPETQFVNAEGQPVYSVEQIAEKFGFPVEKVLSDMQKLGMPAEECDVYRVQ